MLVSTRMNTALLEARDSVTRGYNALNAYFDRILVLTLRRAKERHAHLARSLAGLRYELVYGQDKAELDLDALVRDGLYDPKRARKLHRHGREMSLGHIACTMSHMAIWRSVLGGRAERVLVFEDDAVADPAALDLAPAVLDQLPSQWDLVYFGYNRNEQVTLHDRLKRAFYMGLGALRLIRWTAREASNILPRPYSPNLRRAGLHDCTHAYALTPRAAERLIAFQTPIALNVDSGITRVILRGQIEAYVTEPKLFHQEGLPSYIAGDGAGAADHTPVPDRLAAAG
jgi:glycosyl transferase family 25